jgi:uncharacterized protein with HEPN domain/predicted nucleotidyltransferase
MKPTAPVRHEPVTKPERQRARPRSLASIVRVLQRALPALAEAYKIKSLGVFGSYVRGEQTPTSDLDVLVEFVGGEEGAPREPLAAFLTELLNVKVDVIPSENLARRPYFGRNVLRHIIWLQKDGILQTLHPDALHYKPNGDSMEPKREYLDFIQDILTNMDEAMEYAGDMNSGQLLNDRMRLAAIKYAIQTIGEAASKIPPEVRALYPEIRWGEMMGMRNRIVHDYARIQAEKVWEVVHEDLPNDRMLVADMFEREKKRRGLSDLEKQEPAE